MHNRSATSQIFEKHEHKLCYLIPRPLILVWWRPGWQLPWRPLDLWPSKWRHSFSISMEIDPWRGDECKCEGGFLLWAGEKFLEVLGSKIYFRFVLSCLVRKFFPNSFPINEWNQVFIKYSTWRTDVWCTITLSCATFVLCKKKILNDKESVQDANIITQSLSSLQNYLEICAEASYSGKQIHNLSYNSDPPKRFLSNFTFNNFLHFFTILINNCK